jgi:G3E family GTPase
VAARIRALNPAAPMWRGAAEVDAEALLAHDLFELAGKSEQARRWFAAEVDAARRGEHLGHDHDGHGHEHGHGHGLARREVHGHDPNRHGDAIHAFSLVFDAPLDWTLFGIWLTMLLNRHGAQVLRVKGILNVAGSRTPVAVHGVQHLVHPPMHMAAWPDEDRRSRLVFIVDGLDRTAVERSLMAFAGLGALAPA